MIKICLICENNFEVKYKRIETAKYCSVSCYYLGMKGKIPWNKNKKTGLVPKTAFKKGNIPPYAGKKLPFIIWNKGKEFTAIRGEKHWNWKGGIPKKNKREIMTYQEYRNYLDWQKTVFKRDNWECVHCRKHGGILHADHIKPWVMNPELRFVVSNGRTLCPPCHYKTDTYGKTRSQYYKLPVSLDANVSSL